MSETGAVPVFLNARAGRSRDPAQALYDGFGDTIAVTAAPGASLRSLVADAVAAGEPVIGVAGGDGTMRTAAAVLVHTDTALLCIPTGTLNTFARRQGIVDIAAAATALRERRILRVAVGTIENEYFLNTLTFGEYARIVRRREQYRRFIGKPAAALIATGATLVTLRQTIVHLDVDGETLVRRTPVVWVGLGWGSFPRLTASQERRSNPDLEVVVVRHASKFATTATLMRLARGVLRGQAPVRDPQLEVLHTRAIYLERASPAPPDGSGDAIDATADGELLRTRGAAHVGVLDAALRVLQGPARNVAIDARLT
ncbi:MAG TPA: diacylglycerol kinase family protein [Longimicrobiales bacterium]|nr:diacylglycerol kinase family protein [Longimicrobiales bacterium]